MYCHTLGPRDFKLDKHTLVHPGINLSNFKTPGEKCGGSGPKTTGNLIDEATLSQELVKTALCFNYFI